MDNEETNKRIDRLTCPFCGSYNLGTGKVDTHHYVHCESCLARSRAWFWLNDAISEWERTVVKGHRTEEEPPTTWDGKPDSLFCVVPLKDTYTEKENALIAATKLAQAHHGSEFVVCQAMIGYEATPAPYEITTYRWIS